MLNNNDLLLIDYLKRKVLRCLNAADVLIEKKLFNDSINRQYYAVMHQAKLLLISNKLNVKTHTNLKHMLSLHFTKNKRISKDTFKIFRDLMEERLRADYTNFVDVTEDCAKEFYLKALTFISTTGVLINDALNINDAENNVMEMKKEEFNVLIIGNGAREHAIAWKVKQSKLIDHLFIAPGNAGTQYLAWNADIVNTKDFVKIKQIVGQNGIKLVIVGPELPLVNGIYDFFQHDKQLKHVHILAPSKKGAQLEGSKNFAKMFMQKYNIPTAKYLNVNANNIKQGEDFIDSLAPPYVLKADGLAAGKGVIILNDNKDAKQTLHDMINGMFGDASNNVVVEEFLKGIECSVFVITDGIHYKILPVAKDYKQIGEGNTGPNTGGMGAVSPVPFANQSFMQKVEQQIIIPTINGIQSEQIDYKGFIFFGLMNVNGNPYVIEYNCRLGDPETEAILPRIQSDFLQLCLNAATSNLQDEIITEDTRTVVTVMTASGGYPGKYEINQRISGLDPFNPSLVTLPQNEDGATVPDVIAFHAGTKTTNGLFYTDGGRVIAFSAYGDNIQHAAQKATNAAEAVDFQGKYLRHDIGSDLI